MSSPGYTDEVAEECHDLIDRAEEEAHLHDDDTMSSGQSIPSKMKKKSGLESESSESSSGIKNEGSSMKETISKKVGEIKDTMGMNK